MYEQLALFEEEEIQREEEENGHIRQAPVTVPEWLEQ
jgi:hypothetical protein